MQSFEDVLGAQQDQLAEYNLQLLQLIQNAPEFEGCRSPFDVFCRVHEIKGVIMTRSLLTDYLKGMNGKIGSIDAWVDRLLPTVVHKDNAAFDAVSQQAGSAAVGPSSW